MNPEELRAFLTQRQVRFEEREIEYGTQFRCASGEIFNVYSSGKVVPAGKRTDLSSEVDNWARGEIYVSVEPRIPDEGPKPKSLGPDRRVFIVYGHDLTSRDNLELLLHRMELEPIILQNLPAGGDTIIEKLEHYLGEHGNVGFACVLLTPDDEGYKAGFEDKKQYRARQNVILELGMVLARLGRKRVAILIKESVERPSDIDGLIYIRYKERVDEIKFDLVKELKNAGYSPRTDAL
jgi:predicted nucleotide-binding protein